MLKYCNYRSIFILREGFKKKKYDKLGLLAEAWGGRGQVGAGGPNLLSVFLFIGVILSRGLET